MNERIRELAEQAGCKVMDDGEWYIPSATGLEKIVYTKGIGLEKFAELIVQECIEIVEPCKCGCRCEQEVAITDSIIADIKEHFGVER
jgi:hypothetical protein